MDLDRSSGYVRPLVTGAADSTTEAEARQFAAVCPGLVVQAPVPESGNEHAVFGRVVSAWEGHAVDPEVRFQGSSGGVLTALSQWLVETKAVPALVGSSASITDPSRTVPVSIMTREEAMAASGSRYAPVANTSAFIPGGTRAFVGKPCEVTGACALEATTGVDDGGSAVKLSFFCAGTPSQAATEELVTDLGLASGQVEELRYRGRGWPGRFEVRTKSGGSASLSYDESWGKHLGRQLQWRCKICPDGTGAHADVAVGDFWRADARGYPVFDEQDGSSVVIARTRRGHDLLMRAHADGVIELRDVDLDEVARIQPLQVTRRFTLGARLAARVVSGHRVPRYRGYGLTRIGLRHPVMSARQFAGTLVRSRRTRSR